MRRRLRAPITQGGKARNSAIHVWQDGPLSILNDEPSEELTFWMSPKFPNVGLNEVALAPMNWA